MVRVIILLAPIAGVIAALAYFFYFQSPPPLPDMDVNAWWGPDKLKEKQDTSIKPFKVKFSPEMIQDLRARIKSHRTFTPPLEGVAFNYGFNSLQLDSWLKYWTEKYPFAEREAFFNKYPQFKTNIQGLDIHFIRVKPQAPKGVETVPVLLLHGWPGSVREFYEAVPLLTAVASDRDFVLELIIPSLPGYGFSDPAVRPGLGAAGMAVVMRNLMHRLGFKQFYVQGGDWGSIIGAHMATLFPKEVQGYHTNMPFTMSSKAFVVTILGSIYPPLVVENHLAERMYPQSKVFSNMLRELGYFHLQATKPDTVGVALSDSPVGLLAYILEKFSTWTDLSHLSLEDGGLLRSYSRDQLIDNVMLYWSTGCITTSMRLYAETFNHRELALKLDEIPSSVPTWAIQPKHELGYQSPFIIKFKFPNLLNATALDYGGHFFAFEHPQVFAEDVIKAVQGFRRYNKNTVKTEL